MPPAYTDVLTPPDRRQDPGWAGRELVHLHRNQSARGHFPIERAALKCLCIVVRGLDPTGRGRKPRRSRWKAALDAFAITFEGRILPTENQQCQQQSHRIPDSHDVHPGECSFAGSLRRIAWNWRARRSAIRWASSRWRRGTSSLGTGEDGLNLSARIADAIG